MTRSVAVYGGSFDPPHAAHLLVATWVLRCCDVDELVFVPTAAHSLGKQAAASFEDRCAMVELLAAVVPGSRVSRVEDELPRPSRTLATLEELGRRDPDARFRLVVGADIAAETSRWHRWDAIVALAPPLWIGRAGYDAPVSTAITLPDISSTAIRGRLRAGESTEGLVPTSVRAFIDARGLYRDAT